MSEAHTPDSTPRSDGEWTDEELAAARDLAEKYGDDDPLGRICRRIVQSVDSPDNEEASS